MTSFLRRQQQQRQTLSAFLANKDAAVHYMALRTNGAAAVAVDKQCYNLVPPLLLALGACNANCASLLLCVAKRWYKSAELVGGISL